MEINQTLSCSKIPIKMKGINVTDVSTKANTMIVSGQIEEFEMSFSTKDLTSNYAVPDFSGTIEGILELSEETPIIELRKIPLEDAIEKIYEYIKNNEGCSTSDIIFDLQLDPILVVKALSELEKRNLIEGRDVE